MCAINKQVVCGVALLTRAAEPLPAHPGQHVEAQVAVGGLAEVLQPPKVVAVLPHVLTPKERKIRFETRDRQFRESHAHTYCVQPLATKVFLDPRLSPRSKQKRDLVFPIHLKL